MALNPNIRTEHLNFETPENNPENVLVFLNRDMSIGGSVVDRARLIFPTDDPRDVLTWRFSLNPARSVLKLKKARWPAWMRTDIQAMYEGGDTSTQSLHQAAVNRIGQSPGVHLIEIHYHFPQGVTCSTTPFSNNANHVKVSPANGHPTFGETNMDGDYIRHERNWIAVDLAVDRPNNDQVTIEDEITALAARYGANVNLGV